MGLILTGNGIFGRVKSQQKRKKKNGLQQAIGYGYHGGGKEQWEIKLKIDYSWMLAGLACMEQILEVV